MCIRALSRHELRSASAADAGALVAHRPRTVQRALRAGGSGVVGRVLDRLDRGTDPGEGVVGPGRLGAPDHLALPELRVLCVQRRVGVACRWKVVRLCWCCTRTNHCIISGWFWRTYMGAGTL